MTANYLMQAGMAPGTARVGMYIPTFVIDETNADQPNICYDGKGTGLPELVPNGGGIR